MNCPACQNRNQQQSLQGVSGGAIFGGLALLLVALFGYSVIVQQQEPKG